MHSMMVSKRYPRLLSLLVLACIGDSPSKFRVSTPALMYKVLPQSYQDGQYMHVWLLYELVLLEIG